MQQLAIAHIAHSRVGNADVGGISGGEKKRVAIGMELVKSLQTLLIRAFISPILTTLILDHLTKSLILESHK
jgi:ABC-type molybdate transport system ATPase subunit